MYITNVCDQRFPAPWHYRSCVKVPHVPNNPWFPGVAGWSYWHLTTIQIACIHDTIDNPLQSAMMIHFPAIVNAPPPHVVHQICCSHFSPNNSRKTPTAQALGWGIGVFREFEVWPKFYLRSCAECNITLYCIALYRESILCIPYVAWGYTHVIHF